MKYRIISKAGLDHGVFEGSSLVEAVAVMHGEAGYAVSVSDMKLVFSFESDREVCGDVSDWFVSLVE